MSKLYLIGFIAAFVIVASAAFADSTPYQGIRPSAPCIIQAENYDIGGEGIAYHDYDPTNKSSGYRADGVDIETTTDSGGGYNVSYVTNGEWLKYSINVPVAGNYTVRMRAAGYCNGKYEITIGSRATGLRQFSATGGFQTWTNSDTNMYLDAGEQYLIVYAKSGIDGHYFDDDAVWNLNYIQILGTDMTPPGQIANFSAVTGDSQITLSWDNPSNSDFHSTTIRYSTTAYPTSPTGGLPVCVRTALPGSHDSYIHTGLAMGATYYYAAFTRDNASNWSSSARLCVGLAKPFWDVMSDTWVATDALGRRLPTYAECGPPRPDKQTGIFYFTWLGQHGTGGPYDITKLLAANPTNPSWGPEYAFHHWGESELGYYLSNDAYVMKKHCRMLADAGIDMLALDVTNSFTYTANYTLLCSVLQQIKNEGGKVPKICFIANAGSDVTVNKLYNEFYSQNLYPELWFMWDGKPLILTPPDNLSQTLRDFFTIKQSWAWSHDLAGNPTGWWGNGYDKWAWLDHYPQWCGLNANGIAEEISVSIAQHATTNIGRSYRNGSQPAVDQYSLCSTTGDGLCFNEQWTRALQQDPPFVFITGWNEWVAQRFKSNGSDTFLGRVLPAGETLFVDEYNQEYSRDIEPMKGGHTDNYYYQMIANIRKYKGVRLLDPPSAAKVIAIDGDFSDWDSVAPEYRDHIGDIEHRNSVGWGSAGTYINNTGRNDFVRSKVARDDNYIYFFVETKNSITNFTDPNWMMLFIDSDGNSSTGWNGYDYLVNSPVVDANTTTLKKTINGWNWTTVRNDIAYKVLNNKMEIRIPRGDIDQSIDHNIGLDFHWADNIQKTDDIIEFSVSGDSAPNRRFNYRFNTLPGQVTGFTATPGNGKITLSWHNPADVDFARAVIRYSTTSYPNSPIDGILLADKANNPGSVDSFVHIGLTTGTTYYYSIFSCDLFGNYSPAVNVSSTVLRSATILNSDFAIPSSGWICTGWGFNADPAKWGTIGWDGTVGYPSGAGIRCKGYDAIDNDDRFLREGGEMKRIVSTLGYNNINISYDLRVGSLGVTISGAGTGTGNVYSNDIQDQLLIYYSTTGISGPWIEADWLGRNALLNYTSYGRRFIYLSDLSGASENVDFALKFLWQFNTKIDNGDYGDLDNIKVTGCISGKDGFCANVKDLSNGTVVSLVDKVLYYKSGSVGYIEEDNRTSGIRIEGTSLSSASVNKLVSVAGKMQTKTNGERYIALDAVTPLGDGSVRALGVNNRAVKSAGMDGLLVTVWGTVKAGSVTANSFIITDGSDEEGIKIITSGSPGVSPGAYVTVTGAAGIEAGKRVIYRK